jgi:AraC-like DNA-binding protein
MTLMRLVVHDLEIGLQVTRMQAEVDRQRLRLRNLEAEATRLHRELHQRIPDLPATAAQTPRGPGSRTRQLVEAMMDYIHHHYHRPLALADVAASLRMNASYLSSLFSRTLGLTFHDYLNELRLAQAEALLRNPHARVCEVACAVGYSSANHFRTVFKIREGLSPSAWRLAQPVPSTGASSRSRRKRSPRLGKES